MLDRTRYLRECEDVCQELERESRALKYRFKVDSEDAYLPYSVIAVNEITSRMQQLSEKALDIIERPRQRTEWSQEHLNRVNHFCRELRSIRAEHRDIINDHERGKGFVFELPAKYSRTKDLELDSKLLRTIAIDTDVPITLSFPPQTDRAGDRDILPRLVTDTYYALGHQEFSKRVRTTGSQVMQRELSRFL